MIRQENGVQVQLGIYIKKKLYSHKFCISKPINSKGKQHIKLKLEENVLFCGYVQNVLEIRSGLQELLARKDRM